MEKQFREGMTCSGEVVYGCSGNIGTNTITVIKRDGNNVTYRQNFGLADGQTLVSPIRTDEKWGEFIAIGDDRFFAYSV